MRNSTNEAWTDLGQIDDFLTDIRTLVNNTAATKVNRTGDVMTGPLTMRNANLMFQNPSAANFGYIGSYGTVGQASSGLGFVDSGLVHWNFQVNNDGTFNHRGTGTMNGGLRVIGGRLELRQNAGAQHGEIALYSAGGTVMFLRGRAGGGGMEWVNNDYNDISATLDNAGNFTARGELWANNGGGRVSGNGNLYGGTWGGWLSDWVSNQLNARAPNGAMVHHNSGIAESAQWAAGANTTVDMGDPWVVQGVRTTSGVGWSWFRAVWLRNA
jgi:hypothetical protein